MLIKSADDRKSDVEILRLLLGRSDVTAAQRRAVDLEIRTLSAGSKGERDAAWEIEFTYGESKNFATIHDLRVEHNGNVAQVDHLVINRLLEIWVCESKAFAEGVSINQYGEWSRYVHGRPMGMPSPVEQNRRHVLMLERLFDSGRVQLPKRLGTFSIKPDLKPVVLVSNSARIGRPKTKVDGIDTVFKVERLRAEIDKSFDDRVHRLVTRAIGQDTLQQFARDLAALHQPIAIDWPAKFGMGSAPAAESPKARPDAVCASCGGPVTSSEAFYHRLPANRSRFGGHLYCRSCQPKVGAPDRAQTV